MFDHRFLPEIFKSHVFVIGGREFSSDELLSERGLLPVIAYYAEETAKFVFDGMSLGVEVLEDETALLGQRVEFADAESIGLPESIRAPMVFHAALEVLGTDLEPKVVVLDELMRRLELGEPICAAPGL